MKASLLFLICSLFALIDAKRGFGPGDQEWGYVTVRPKAHMFWWLYHTTAVTSEFEKKPLIVWLSGGPGVSSAAFGNFDEIGPLDAKLKQRNYTWVNDYNVLFIDNPVGTGFSYVESLDLLSKDNHQIAKDLTQCIKDFYAQFPKFEKTPTYIAAESYGGKMAVEFAYLWYKEQKEGTIKSNFKGISLIDSTISPKDYIKAMGPYLLNLGFVDSDGYAKINEGANRFENAVNEEEWVKAYEIRTEIFSLVRNLTAGIDIYNVLTKIKAVNTQEKKSEKEVQNFYSEELLSTMKRVKRILGLKSNFGSQDQYVNNALIEDSRKPVVHLVEKLLNETTLKISILNGQLDLIINTPGQIHWVENLKWRNAIHWLTAPRLPIIVNNVIEGYSKEIDNLKFYWVNRSGHMIPSDNPVAMKKILEEFTQL